MWVIKKFTKSYFKELSNLCLWRVHMQTFICMTDWQDRNMLGVTETVTTQLHTSLGLVTKKSLFSSILFSDIQGRHFGILGWWRGAFEINKQVGKIRSCRLDLIFILFYFSFEFWKRIRKYLLGDTPHAFLPPSNTVAHFYTNKVL